MIIPRENHCCPQLLWLVALPLQPRCNCRLLHSHYLPPGSYSTRLRCDCAADAERAMDRVVLLSAETSRRVPLAPSLLLQYWLAVSMQPGSYHLQVFASLAR